MYSLNTWGPAAWTFLHSIAHSYPFLPSETEKSEMLSFLPLFCSQLPCPRCRSHCTLYMLKNLDDLAVSSRDRIVRFMHDFHNEVNRRTGKREVSFEEHEKIVSSRSRSGSGDMAGSYRKMEVVSSAAVSAITSFVVTLLVVASLRAIRKTSEEGKTKIEGGEERRDRWYLPVSV